MVVGFANGAFDGLHDGHKHFLRSCMMNCDKLVVALNNDLSVKRRKGDDRPKHRLGIRQAAVAEFIREGDGTMNFETEGELFQCMLAVEPNVLFKGEDYIGRSITAPVSIRIHWVARHPGYSTTALEEFAEENYQRGILDASSVWSASTRG